ncbi:hypothetical protein Sste5346_004972 [Sporothrix stenoceras]|uniref:Protein kinase domain-containing protein n=1 Tax=Sporothrix stenoceras TaxID=5173 RepID=A0ABR3Z6Z4_9PEZI
MHTYCGTSWYWAPDLFDEEIQASGYQASVDIWSTGVVFFEWMYHGRPNYAPYDMSCPGDGRRWTLGWAQLLVRTVASRCSKSTNDTLETTALDLLKHMLVIDANSRYTATRCLEEGRRSGLFEQSDTVHISYGDDAGNEPGSDKAQGNGTLVSEDSTALTVLNHNVEKRMQSIVQASCDRIMHISGRMLRETAGRDAALMGTLFEASLDKDDQAVEDDSADTSVDIEQPQELDTAPPQSAKFLLPDRVQAPPPGRMQTPPNIPLVTITTLPNGRLTSENLAVVDNELKAMAIETPGTAQDPAMDEHFPGLRDLIS